MHLENIFCGNDGPLAVENLISSCHVLKDLTVVRSIDRYNVEVLKKLLSFKLEIIPACCAKI
ncbi:unnamed protein product, partial [Arabidopsis halleri]